MALALSAALMLPLAAQTPDTAAIRGTVTDPTGAAVPSAVVVATNSLNSARHSAVTGANGQFTFAALPVAGVYTLTGSHAGFAPARIPGLRLKGGTTATVA
ncbi:MAG: carboxypeptidase-like regulatory domain-containing protein, partial [Terriglobales bacterium]